LADDLDRAGGHVIHPFRWRHGVVPGRSVLERGNGVNDGLGFLEVDDGQGAAQAADARTKSPRLITVRTVKVPPHRRELLCLAALAAESKIGPEAGARQHPAER
jgi:hypothetical protein